METVVAGSVDCTNIKFVISCVCCMFLSCVFSVCMCSAASVYILTWAHVSLCANTVYHTLSYSLLQLKEAFEQVVA